MFMFSCFLLFCGSVHVPTGYNYGHNYVFLFSLVSYSSEIFKIV